MRADAVARWKKDFSELEPGASLPQYEFAFLKKAIVEKRLSLNNNVTAKGTIMSTNTRYRVGLVGTGGIARAHGSACQQAPSAELAAICDVSENALAGFGEQFDVAPENRYLSLEEMLDAENLDIAIICTWGAFHAEVGIQISESRQVKAILCEKPFTSTAAEAEAFVGAAQENGILVAEAFKFRHHPMHLKAKELIDSGAIGEFMTLRSTFCTGGGGGGPEARKPEANWRFNKAKGGGSIYDLACYNIHHGAIYVWC